MTNTQIARTLDETAALMELTGGNPFRRRAYSNAARIVSRLDEPVVALLEQGSLTDVPGIGAGLEAQIRSLVETGSFDLRDELLSAIPPRLPELLHIQGLGTKKIRQLWDELGITSMDELEAAATEGRLAQVHGFGKKMQERILHGIELHRRYHARRRYAPTLMTVARIVQRLRNVEGIARAELSGELRRKMETVARAEVIVATDDTRRLADVLAEWLTAPPAPVEGDGIRFRGELADGLPLDVLCVRPERFGTAWWRQTGAGAHVRAFEAAFGAPEDLPEEERIYERAGLPFIEPELREGQGELDAARRGALPALISVADLRGSLHNHTTFSDGRNTLREMADAARAMGLSYFGICDHSRSLTIASGLSIDEVRRQQDEIRTLNEHYAASGDAPFRIFSGTECDILADGTLDYPDDVLASFDFVVASIHSAFRMTEDQATERVLRAVENPYTSILGHATGRLLLAREGYPLDHERVIAACAAHGVAIELNANPRRLDMDWRWLRTATEQGVFIAINPDAHSTEELYNVQWGVAVARKGWLTAAHCLNALPLDDVAAWMERRHTQRLRLTT